MKRANFTKDIFNLSIKKIICRSYKELLALTVLRTEVA
jgi:hypothetical protein